MTKLSHCHCGGKPEMVMLRQNGASYNWVECPSCGNATGSYETVVEAVEDWNGKEARRDVGVL